MARPYQISDWYDGRHTCHTASAAPLRGGTKILHNYIKEDAERETNKKITASRYREYV